MTNSIKVGNPIYNQNFKKFTIIEVNSKNIVVEKVDKFGMKTADRIPITEIKGKTILVFNTNPK